ncbi:hypothetical protein Shyhy02_34450 [Streptomyces hygroscopicus subsp. hygroscopicus]|nr:hypothetical protein Shyhy02_34450 [Streptomyces hygroscopicus subsp. hygroscopicus]
MKSRRQRCRTNTAGARRGPGRSTTGPAGARRALPSRIGGRLPLTCTGVGKALLAFSGAELTEEVLAAPLPRLTPHSVTDPERLRTAIEQAQVAGLAYEEEEAAAG